MGQSGLKLLTRCTFIDRCCNTKAYVLCEYVLRCGRKIYNLLCSGANEVLDTIAVVAKKKHLLPIGIKSVSSEIIVTGLGSASSIGDVRNYRLTSSELLPPVQKSLHCISIKTIQLDQEDERPHSPQRGPYERGLSLPTPSGYACTRP